MNDYVQTSVISECPKHMAEYISPNIALTQTEDSLSCMLRYMAGHVDQVTYDRAVAKEVRTPETG